MSPTHRTPDLDRRAFARTNAQTVDQRVRLLRELAPGLRSVGEICCGDCSRQHAAYRDELGVERYRGLDVVPEIARANQERGIDCALGDALDPGAMRAFLDFDALFFGPPLSEACDAHSLLSFPQVTPGYADFTRLLYGELGYDGVLVCVCPKSTTMGDVRRLHGQIAEARRGVGLRVLHYSHATVTGGGEATEPRLKYIELWMAPRFEDLWEVRVS